MLQRTRIITDGCNDGTCPNISETTRPQVAAVQGYKPTTEELAAMGLPEGETVVLVPWSLLDSYGQR